jgi:hypothetical protein
MNLRGAFPLTTRLLRALGGSVARRVYIGILVLPLLLSVVARVRCMVMTHKFNSILSGLEQVRIDQTSEEELRHSLPQFTGGHAFRWPDGAVEKSYWVAVSDEADWMWLIRRATSVGIPYNWAANAADWLGYRYMHLAAIVLVRNGKVSRISYNIANWPVLPFQAGDIIRAKSFHAMWVPRRRIGMWVPSVQDQSPQFRVSSYKGSIASDETMHVRWSSDALPNLVADAFRIDLSCFWGLRACSSAHQMAPQLWQDEKNIQTATLDRLHSRNPCPDRVLEGRVRYLLDVDVLLLEVEGSHQTTVDEEGEHYPETDVSYKLVRVVRGQAEGYPSRFTMRLRRLIPAVAEPTSTMSNPVPYSTRRGDRVLYFTNDDFDSCRIVPATPSALATVETTAHAPKLREDEPVNFQ